MPPPVEGHDVAAGGAKTIVVRAGGGSQHGMPPGCPGKLHRRLDHRTDAARPTGTGGEVVRKDLQHVAADLPMTLAAHLPDADQRSLEGARVLVIGGAGFIGSHIVDQLLHEPVAEIVVLDNLVRGTRQNLEEALQDERVRFVEGSIADRALLGSLMTGTDYVCHLAALWLYECVHEPRKAVDINVVGAWNVIEAAIEANVKRVVYSSSASVYGDAVFTPMTEDHPFNNRTLYGATKIAGEQFYRAMNEQHGLDYVGLRYMNVYGPRMDYLGTYVSVIMKVLDRIDAGERPTVFGDGSQAYDFVHVSDVARANILALKSKATDSFYNVGTGVKT